MDEVSFLKGIGQVVSSISGSVVSLVLLFVTFQLFFLKLPRSYIYNLAWGLLFSIIGVILFLQGVNIGFMPTATAIGAKLGAMEQKWVVVLVGFVFGFLATLSEPAVRVLGYQVEQSSSGFIRKPLVVYTTSFGVAILVMGGMVRIVWGIPLMYIIIPGYILAFVMLLFSNKDFVAIAFDSGAAATGAMAVTFMTALALGVSSVKAERDPLIDGFGLIALIALAPALSVMLLGLIFRSKLRKMEVKKENGVKRRKLSHNYHRKERLGRQSN